MTDVDGMTTSGRLLDADTSQLVIGISSSRVAIAGTRIRTVAIDGDSLSNGIIDGGGMGFLAGGLLVPAVSGHGAMFGWGILIGATVGGWLDWRERHQTIVYRAP